MFFSVMICGLLIAPLQEPGTRIKESGTQEKEKKPRKQTQNRRSNLTPENIKEIGEIRKRLGIRLFPAGPLGDQSDEQFSQYLKKIETDGALTPDGAPPKKPKRLNQPKIPQAKSPQKTHPDFGSQQSQPGSSSKFPSWAPISGPKQPENPVFRPVRPASGFSNSGRIRTGERIPSTAGLRGTRASVLLDAVGSLDQLALELEKKGEFKKSKKLRKLSRNLQKQIRLLSTARDN